LYSPSIVHILSQLVHFKIVSVENEDTDSVTVGLLSFATFGYVPTQRGARTH